MCEFCDFDIYMEKMEDMLNDDDYIFAYDTLESIYSWVDKQEHITDNQKIAIDNIQQSLRREI